MTRRPVHRTVPWSTIATASLLLCVLSACLGASPERAAGADTDRLKVVAEFSILAEFATAVGGERVSVDTIVALGGDPHAYEPRPGDAARISDADLVLEHGLGLSPWMGSLRANAQGPVVTIGAVVADHAVRSDDGVLDPHLWMSPELAADYVDRIAEALTEVDPDHGSLYATNALEFQRELADLDDELQAIFTTIPPEHRQLVTPHDAYRYFAEHFGLEVLGTLVGVTTEEEPSARQVSELVDAVRDSGVPAIFIESTVPPRQIERVAQDADVAIAGPLYGDSLGEPGSGAESYVGMMRTNTITIVEALGGESP